MAPLAPLVPLDRWEQLEIVVRPVFLDSQDLVDTLELEVGNQSVADDEYFVYTVKSV